MQLHCPPSEVIDADATYDALDALVADGSIAAYGVRVETGDQALARSPAPRRLGPDHPQRLPAQAPRRGAARRRRGRRRDHRPGAAGLGLLSGRYDAPTTFADDDHRSYNRDGSAFDVGETFSGVDYATGLPAAARSSPRWSPPLTDVTPAQAALAWCAQQPGVTSVIPGARNPDQARANAAAARWSAARRLPHRRRQIYDERIRESVHARW